MSNRAIALAAEWFWSRETRAGRAIPIKWCPVAEPDAPSSGRYPVRTSIAATASPSRASTSSSSAGLITSGGMICSVD